MGLSTPLSPTLVHLFSRHIQVNRSEFQRLGICSFNLSLYCGTEHCIEMIRQQLMCTADVGMITYEWVRYFLWFNLGSVAHSHNPIFRGINEPYPDFNTKHQCRNFEKILAWADANALHVRRDHVLRFGNEVDLVDRP